MCLKTSFTKCRFLSCFIDLKYSGLSSKGSWGSAVLRDPFCEDHV